MKEVIHFFSPKTKYCALSTTSRLKKDQGIWKPMFWFCSQTETLSPLTRYSGLKIAYSILSKYSINCLVAKPKMEMTRKERKISRLPLPSVIKHSSLANHKGNTFMIHKGLSPYTTLSKKCSYSVMYKRFSYFKSTMLRNASY